MIRPRRRFQMRMPTIRPTEAKIPDENANDQTEADIPDENASQLDEKQEYTVHCSYVCMYFIWQNPFRLPIVVKSI